MTTVDEITAWMQDVLKTSKSYSNHFYYDGHRVILNYEKAIPTQKEKIQNIDGRQPIL